MKTLNTNDVFLRNVGISLMALLNSEMQFDLARGDHNERIAIPFMYNYGTDEGFLKDFYVGLPDDCKAPVAEGTYDQLPRGVITINSFQVKSSDLTNKYIRGLYTEQEKGVNDQNVMTAYSALLFSLPMNIKFDVSILCDNLNKSLKIAEEMLKLNYSNRVWYFQYHGIRIPAGFQFPENESIDKSYKFTYADNNKTTMKLTLDVETYLPSFEQTSKVKASNVMERINLNKNDGEV